MILAVLLLPCLSALEVRLLSGSENYLEVHPYFFFDTIQTDPNGTVKPLRDCESNNVCGSMACERIALPTESTIRYSDHDAALTTMRTRKPVVCSVRGFETRAHCEEYCPYNCSSDDEVRPTYACANPQQQGKDKTNFLCKLRLSSTEQKEAKLHRLQCHCRNQASGSIDSRGTPTRPSCHPFQDSPLVSSTQGSHLQQQQAPSVLPSACSTFFDLSERLSSLFSGSPHLDWATENIQWVSENRLLLSTKYWKRKHDNNTDDDPLYVVFLLDLSHNLTRLTIKKLESPPMCSSCVFRSPLSSDALWLLDSSATMNLQTDPTDKGPPSLARLDSRVLQMNLSHSVPSWGFYPLLIRDDLKRYWTREYLLVLADLRGDETWFHKSRIFGEYWRFLHVSTNSTLLFARSLNGKDVDVYHFHEEEHPKDEWLSRVATIEIPSEPLSQSGGFTCSEDANRCFVSHSSNSFENAISVFHWNGTRYVWSSQILASHLNLFGFSLATDAVGNILWVSAPLYRDQHGAVTLWTWSHAGPGSSWKQVTLFQGPASHRFFGTSLFLTPDGSRLVATAQVEKEEARLDNGNDNMVELSPSCVFVYYVDLATIPPSLHNLSMTSFYSGRAVAPNVAMPYSINRETGSVAVVNQNEAGRELLEMITF